MDGVSVVVRNLPDEAFEVLSEHMIRDILRRAKVFRRGDGVVEAVLTEPVETGLVKRKTLPLECGRLEIVEVVRYRVVPKLGVIPLPPHERRLYRVNFNCIRVNRRLMNRVKAELLIYGGPTGWRIMRALEGRDTAVLRLPHLIEPTPEAVAESRVFKARLVLPPLRVKRVEEWEAVLSLLPEEVQSLAVKLWLVTPPVTVTEDCIKSKYRKYRVLRYQGVGRAYRVTVRHGWVKADAVVTDKYPLLLSFQAKKRVRERLKRCTKCIRRLGEELFKGCPPSPPPSP